MKASPLQKAATQSGIAGGRNFLESDIADIADLLGEVAHDFAGKTVLISGAGGFLGKYFVAVLDYLNRNVLDKPCKVLAMDIFITGLSEDWQFEESDTLSFFRHDIIEKVKVAGAIDYIVHASGIASPFYYRKHPLETFDVAINGTRNFLEIAREKGSRFTFFSSSEIYGDPAPQYVPTPESYRGHVSCQGPRACYDESKRAAETLCYIYAGNFGVHTNTIRPFNVYGPGMREKDYRVLPNFANRIKAQQPIQIYGDGRQTRTYCYVADAVNGFLRVIARGQAGEAYNIGNPNPEISVNDLVKSIEGVLGRPIAHSVTPYPESYPADEPLRRCPDISKASAHVDYQPAVPLDEGLKRFLKWSDLYYTGDT